MREESAKQVCLIRKQLIQTYFFFRLFWLTIDFAHKNVFKKKFTFFQSDVNKAWKPLFLKFFEMQPCYVQLKYKVQSLVSEWITNNTELVKGWMNNSKFVKDKNERSLQMTERVEKYEPRPHLMNEVPVKSWTCRISSLSGSMTMPATFLKRFSWN